jgi:stage II sporulation protein D
MRFLRSSTTASLVLLYALAVSPLIQAQDRPRRAETNGGEWPVTAPATVKTGKLTNEPTIRIGLTTGARSVSISTAAPSLECVALDGKVTPLDVARVRVDVRALGPLPSPPETFQVELAGYASQSDADRDAREIHEQSKEPAVVAAATDANSWKIKIGEVKPSRVEAEELVGRLDDQGIGNAVITRLAPPAPATPDPATAGARTVPSANGLKTISYRFSPTRELAVSAGPGPAVSSRTPLSFGAGGGSHTPVVYNNSTYRGQIEVFANARGSLTVVNVVSMEDYVKGVVPNELPPGSFPELEALKAQAVAARTYAIKNIGQFASEGFDLLPTTRSQVYFGFASEKALSSRAVDETKGIVATYQGEPIAAYYTSTCGGRTEDGENILNDAAHYLRGRECSVEGQGEFTPFTIRSERDVAEVRSDTNAGLVREAALLSVFNFPLTQDRISDEWLNGNVSHNEARGWLAGVARLSHQPLPAASDDDINPAGFSTALAAALYGEGRADTLLNSADATYNLSFRDGQDVPERNRADVAMLMRDGILSLNPDASLRPRSTMSRGRMLHAIFRALDQRSLFPLQKATTKTSGPSGLVLKGSSRNRDQTIKVSGNAYLFRAYGDGLFQMRSVEVMGGEPIAYHVNSSGEVDYLELRPAPSGASAERFSNFTNWTKEMSLSAVRARLSRWSRGIGSLTDIRIARQGSSRRVIDLELVGTTGTGHVRGGAIRSALRLSEQLFVIDRHYDANGQPVSFTFTGRGLGHGVGLCQVGAYGLARAGLNYEKILKSYYTGIDLTRMY